MFIEQKETIYMTKVPHPEKDIIIVILLALDSRTPGNMN